MFLTDTGQWYVLVLHTYKVAVMKNIASVHYVTQSVCPTTGAIVPKLDNLSRSSFLGLFLFLLSWVSVVWVEYQV